MWLQAVLWALIGLSSHVVWLIGVILVVFVATAQVFGITVLSYQLSVTPDHLLSRVGTAFRLIAWSSVPLGAAVGGALLSWFGPATTSLAFGIWVLLLAVYATLRGDLLRLDQEPEVGDR